MIDDVRTSRRVGFGFGGGGGRAAAPAPLYYFFIYRKRKFWHRTTSPRHSSPRAPADVAASSSSRRRRRVVAMVDMKSLFEAERARRIEAKRATAAAEETSSSNADEIRAAPAPCDLSPRTPLRLADHAVGADRGVAGLHYVPDFLSADEEAAVLRGVYAPDAASRWVASGQRRVQNWGGRPSELDVAEPLPPFAAALARAVSDAGVVAEGAAPNHVLVNEYRRPAGITPHNDGDIYNPRVGASPVRPPRRRDRIVRFSESDHALTNHTSITNPPRDHPQPSSP